jgi:hypothetical protein
LLITKLLLKLIYASAQVPMILPFFTVSFDLMILCFRLLLFAPEIFTNFTPDNSSNYLPSLDLLPVFIAV